MVNGAVERSYKYRVKINQPDAQLTWYYISSNATCFGAYLNPSSGGTTVCIQKLILIILKRG